MTRETLKPASHDNWLQLRAGNINSTEISSLFGISPYMTEFELWHMKREAKVTSIDDNERMLWGRRLQEAIAVGVAADQGWDVRPMDEYIRLPEQRLGSSFDFAINEEGILEIKNVDSLVYRDGWLVDGDDIQAPAHIELQLQHQLLVSGRPYGCIAALVGGNRVAIINRQADPAVHQAILNKAAKFWASIEANTPPSPDFVKDAQFIASLYNLAEPGKILDASGDADIASMAKRDKELQEAGKRIDEERAEIKARILMRIGDVEKVIGEGFTVSCGVQGPTQIEAHERSGFRRFRITWKKEKK